MSQFFHITFSEPWWLLLLLGIPVLVWSYVHYFRKRTPIMWTNGYVAPTKSSLLHFSPPDYLFAIRLLVLLLIILALANPQLKYRNKIRLPYSTTDIIFALDASKSMLIEDLKPNRSEALKSVLNRFVALRMEDRIGMVLYAGESINWCPLTKNSQQLLQSINTMQNNKLNDGTAIGSGLVTAIKALQNSKVKSKVIVLLTDGENNAGIIDPLLAAQFAQRLQIKIYTISIGRTGFAPMPLKDLQGNTYYQKVYCTINEPVLKKIAQITGGNYFKATNVVTLRKVYNQINQMETKQERWVYRDRYDSYRMLFVIVAILLLLSETILKMTLLRTWPS
jgi:Ca-activated chloride channel family protein